MTRDTRHRSTIRPRPARVPRARAHLEHKITCPDHLLLATAATL